MILRKFKMLSFLGAAVLLQNSVMAAPSKPTAQTKRAASAKTVIAPAPEVPIAIPLNPIIPAAKRMCNAPMTNGVGVTRLKKGLGASPKPDDFALVKYIGYLEKTGEVFDQNAQAVFQLDSLIPGFSLAVVTMRRGDISRFCIPSGLGYGEKGTEGIPANSNLVFQVELLDFVTRAEYLAAQQTPAEAPTEPKPAN